MAQSTIHTTASSTQNPWVSLGNAMLQPLVLTAEWMEVMRLSNELLQKYVSDQEYKHFTLPADELGIMDTFKKLTNHLMQHPTHLFDEQVEAWWDYYTLENNIFMQMMGFPARLPIDDHADRRFKNPSWQESFVFLYIKQSYLILTHRWMRVIAKVRNMDEHEQKKLLFFSRVFINALSPSNFVMTNPEVLRTTINSGGHNLLTGLKHLLEDLNASQEMLHIKMTDEKQFELGKNIATTPGKVVYENRLMQIIQYNASTDKVYRKPLIVVPPWINKYYILDLQPKNSFIKYCVDQGFTTFVISWINPDASLSDVSFEQYMQEGTLKALEVALDITMEKQANAVSYCLGGTLLAATLAYMAKQKDTRISSATYFTSLIDFSIPGDLGVFIDEDQLQHLEAKMQKRGYLEGTEMASTFNMLRDSDLIWSFVINNYLLGRDPMPFDLLYWNNDATRMPATMHAFYLRNMYQHNRLKDKGGISLLNTPINVCDITVPSYCVSTIDDHIAPWQGAYLSAKLLRGSVKFVLGGSGHIAGIINPVNANKYSYRINPHCKKLPNDPEQWLAGAEQHSGSWWTDWADWIIGHHHQKGKKDQIAARIPGSTTYPPIEEAPGRYVKVRLRPQR